MTITVWNNSTLPKRITFDSKSAMATAVHAFRAYGWQVKIEKE